MGGQRATVKTGKSSIFLSRIGFLLLLWPVLAFSQTTKPIPIKQRNQPAALRLSVAYAGDSILQAVKQDSLSLVAAIDSLQKKGYPLAQLAYKADSLRQVFAARHQRILGSVKTTAPKATAILSQAQQALSKDLVPSQVSTVVNQLLVAIPSDIPPVPGLNTNQMGLPHTPLPSVPTLPNTTALTDQVTEGAKDFFAHHQQELNEARRKLARYNGRLEKIDNLQDLKGKYLTLNPLKGKPWPERVVLGTLWQFSNQEQYHIDLGPSLAWRLTDLFSLGAGFQYRLSISIKHQPWINSSDKVYGYHTFLDGQIKKGFFGRLQYEDLSTQVPCLNATTGVESTSQEWVKGLLIGIGKTYAFYKQLNGYALLQYNILHEYRHTPYLRPVQARIGFYIHANNFKKPKQEQAKP